MSEIVNFRNLTLDDIVAVLNDTGLITKRSDFAYADDNDLFKYVGCKNGSAQYIVALPDSEREGWFYVSRIFITIGHDKLQADYGGNPEFESQNEASIDEYVEKTCQ